MTKEIGAVRDIEWKKIAMLTVAGIVNAIGITIFLDPVNLYDSGISGTAMLIDNVTDGRVSLSLCLIVLNIPLLLYGLRRQGAVFTIYSIYAVAVYSAVAYLIEHVLPIDVSVASPLAGQDLLLCAIFGGLISGTGSGLVIRSGGAIDGIEVMAVIHAKRLGITVGTFVMAYNAVLYTICGVMLDSWILPLYSIVTYMAALKTVDFIIEGFDRAKSAMIVTDEPELICTELSRAFETGMTKIRAVGGYSNQEKTVIYFVVNRFQVTRMKDIVREIDPSAYITITEVADIFSKQDPR